MSRSEQILAFWFGAPGDPDHGRPRKIWFEKDAALDAEVRRCFLADYKGAAAGALDHWQETPRGALALIVLLDQFPRNMFRDDPRAYASDAKARAVARRAIDAGFDRALPPIERRFLYLPFEHSEDLADQRRSVALFRDLGDKASIEWATRHLEIVERFGRFPHRNAALGRETTPEEAAFLKEPDSSF
ncbi:MAG: DUF924 family protein [Alphaproteobacteria bacterium]